MQEESKREMIEEESKKLQIKGILLDAIINAKDLADRNLAVESYVKFSYVEMELRSASSY